MQRDVRILNISLYGSGLAGKGAALSGAHERMLDYASYVRELAAIVPAKEEAALVHHTDSYTVYPVTCSGTLSFYVAAWKKARALHREKHVDVIMVDNPHIGGVFGTLLARSLGTLLLVHSMADMIKNPWYRKERLSNYLKATLMFLAVRGADMIRVSTDYEVKRLEKTSFAHKVHKVPFYIDVNEFKQKLELLPGTENNNILYVGRLGLQKDIEVLIRAFRGVASAVPEAHLVLVGDGPKRASLQALVKKLRIESQVTFTGAIPYKDVVTHFRNARVFAISSLYEGTCMVLHEAAAAKLPIVTTRFAGAVDFVRDGVDGYVVPVRDYRALSEALVRTLSETKKTKAMGEAVHERLDAFTRTHALSCWEELVGKLLVLKTQQREKKK